MLVVELVIPVSFLCFFLVFLVVAVVLLVSCANTVAPVIRLKPSIRAAIFFITISPLSEKLDYLNL